MRRIFTLLLATLLLAGCGGGTATPTPAVPTATPTPRQLADQAAAAMAGVKSVHFSMQIEGQPPASGFALQISSAEGDVVAPDRLHAKLKAKVGPNPIETEVTSIGKDTWLKDPLSGTFQPLPPGQVGSLALLDKEQGAPFLLRSLQDPGVVGQESVDGADTVALKGTLDPKTLTRLLGGAPAANPVQTQVWIGQGDNRVRRVKFTGPIAQGEPSGISRTITLSNFDQNVTIERPAQG